MILHLKRDCTSSRRRNIWFQIYGYWKQEWNDFSCTPSLQDFFSLQEFWLYWRMLATEKRRFIMFEKTLFSICHVCQPVIYVINLKNDILWMVVNRKVLLDWPIQTSCWVRPKEVKRTIKDQPKRNLSKRPSLSERKLPLRLFESSKVTLVILVEPKQAYNCRPVHIPIIYFP